MNSSWIKWVKLKLQILYEPKYGYRTWIMSYIAICNILDYSPSYAQDILFFLIYNNNNNLNKSTNCIFKIKQLFYIKNVNTIKYCLYIL